eukprot:480158-Prymnesium_polylepis.1
MAARLRLADQNHTFVAVDLSKLPPTRAVHATILLSTARRLVLPREPMPRRHPGGSKQGVRQRSVAH